MADIRTPIKGPFGSSPAEKPPFSVFILLCFFSCFVFPKENLWFYNLVSVFRFFGFSLPPTHDFLTENLEQQTVGGIEKEERPNLLSVLARAERGRAAEEASGREQISNT